MDLLIPPSKVVVMGNTHTYQLTPIAGVGNTGLGSFRDISHVEGKMFPETMSVRPATTGSVR
jgi:hypothetical protein